MAILWTQKHFAAAFPAFMVGLVTDLHNTSTIRAGDEIVRRIQRAPVLQKATRHRTPGYLAGSFYVKREGTTTTTGYSAEYAPFIDIGRRWSKPFSRTLGRGRTKEYRRRLGSKQARKGMTRPAYYGLRRDWPKVLVGVVAEVNARHGTSP